jgi:predicted dithiol-disulfide oxidoreductase (DUF899 family)
MSTSFTEQNQKAAAGHPVVSQAEWIEARKELLAKEKEYTRLGDQLSVKRRELPWVKVGKDYVFEGPEGKLGLADLFQGRSQLIVHHLMFTPGDTAACPGCSYQADHIAGPLQHLRHHDVMIVAVSRAPLSEIAPFKERMGWHFDWVSSHGTDFNRDFRVTFTPEEIASGKIDYNFSTSPYLFEELPGISVFIKGEDGSIYRTYSAYSRGLDVLIGAHHYLDLTPLGRNEEGDGKDWVKYHDRYEEASGPSCCQSGK